MPRAPAGSAGPHRRRGVPGTLLPRARRRAGAGLARPPDYDAWRGAPADVSADEAPAGCPRAAAPAPSTHRASAACCSRSPTAATSPVRSASLRPAPTARPIPISPRSRTGTGVWPTPPPAATCSSRVASRPCATTCRRSLPLPVEHGFPFIQLEHERSASGARARLRRGVSPRPACRRSSCSSTGSTTRRTWRCAAPAGRYQTARDRRLRPRRPGCRARADGGRGSRPRQPRRDPPVRPRQPARGARRACAARSPTSVATTSAFGPTTSGASPCPTCCVPWSSSPAARSRSTTSGRATASTRSARSRRSTCGSPTAVSRDGPQGRRPVAAQAGRGQPLSSCCGGAPSRAGAGQTARTNAGWRRSARPRSWPGAGRGHAGRQTVGLADADATVGSAEWDEICGRCARTPSA